MFWMFSGGEAELRLGLHLHLPGPPEPVEVVHQQAPEVGLEAVEDRVHRDAERLHLLPVEVHLHLGDGGAEGGEEPAELRPLGRGGEELAGGLIEVSRASACPVLHLKLQPPAFPRPGIGGGVKTSANASGYVLNSRRARSRIAASCVSWVRRSSQGFRFTIRLALLEAVHVCEDVPSGLRHDTLHALHFAQETLGPSHHRIGALH